MAKGDARAAVIERLMSLPYHRVIEADPEGTYSARVLEFDGCFSGGGTPAEAAVSLDEAMALWLDGELRARRAIPEPWGSREYSGRLVLRLPRSLHQRSAERAHIEEISLNQLLVAAIAEYVGSD